MATVMERIKEILDTGATDLVRNFGWHDFDWDKEEAPNIAAIKAQYLAAYVQIHGEAPEESVGRRLGSTTTLEDTIHVLQDLYANDPMGNDVFLASSRFDMPTVGPAGDAEIIDGWHKNKDGEYVQESTGTTISEPEFRARFPESAPTSGQGGYLEQLYEDIAGGVPGLGGVTDREMGFIGNLDAPTTYGIVDGKRVPVDAQGRPVDPNQFHQPKGIYTGFDETNAQRIAEGYTTPRTIEGGTVDIPTPGRMPTGDPFLATNVQHVQRYHYGFQWEPASWDPVEVARLKDRLVNAGLLDSDDRSGGSGWSHYEAKAMEQLAVAANGTGEMWGFTLGEMERNPVGGGGGGGSTTTRAPFVAPSYLAPDMDLLKQAVKESVRGRLGREPTAAEMSQLIVGLDSDYKSAYNVQVEASRSEYDATTRAIDTETTQSGGEFRMVDPASSFAERFESRFTNELGFKKRRDDLNERQAYTDATMRMIDSVAGGG